MSGLFHMDFKEPTRRVHVSTLGTANECGFESTSSTTHTVAIVLYAKIDAAKVKSFESHGRTVKPIANLGDAAYYSGNGLDVVIGTRMISMDQEPFGDEDGLFAGARLLLSRIH